MKFMLYSNWGSIYRSFTYLPFLVFVWYRKVNDIKFFIYRPDLVTNYQTLYFIKTGIKWNVISFYEYRSNVWLSLLLLLKSVGEKLHNATIIFSYFSMNSYEINIKLSQMVEDRMVLKLLNVVNPAPNYRPVYCLGVTFHPTLLNYNMIVSVEFTKMRNYKNFA